ncbi:MAG TPA: PHP domain-containing protein [Gemmatimonadaceae bacterium]|nr:PHP domain-containing protein [Gemmatimonadaceae bacterium]
MQYSELHAHTAFSLLDGAALPEPLVARAKELGLAALAITDHDELGGIVRFATAAREAELPAIIGAELTVVVPPNGGNAQPLVTHLPLLAESRDGYANLSTLVTLGRQDVTHRGEPRVTLDQLAAHAAGLFALTGCPRGWVPTLAARGEPDAACEAAATLLDIFDRRVAIECWDHGLPEERATTTRLIEIARALDVSWVVTNDVHYARARDRMVHDVLSCLRHDKTLDTMGTRLRPNAEWYLKSPAQIARRWRGNLDGVRATAAVAERCTFRLDQLDPTLPAFPLPPGVSADEYLARLVEQGAQERWGEPGTAKRTAEHERQIQHELALIARLGLAGYFLIVWDIVRFARREGILCQGRGSAANSAVCYCLGITAVDPIRLTLLFERFLSEERTEAPDIDIDFSHRERERVIQYVYERYGRDHAAMVCEQITYRGKSAVRDAARVLGFSVEQADSLAMLSDRFSAKATAESLRARPADDAESDGAVASALGTAMVHGTEATTRSRAEKEKAKQAHRPMTSADRPTPNAAYEPYGSPNAQSAGTKDLARIPRALHEGASRGNRWEDPYAGDDHVERRNPTTALQATGGASVVERAGLDPNDKRVRALAEIVGGLHQLPRHRSIHVGGFVLTAEPLCEVVPIEPASMPGRTVIQWEKDDLDPAGLVKIDLLGLGMLTLIQDCLLYIRQTRGVTIDLATLDMTDQAVYDDLCAADTIGVFQVESRAQMNTLPRLKPRCFYDLVVEVAIIRPGPIQGDMVHPYLRRRNGEEPVTYLHPSLEPILKRTLGVPLFQEQGMQVAIALAGFTAGDADVLRRAMGHKRSRERMAAICQRMLDGMAKNGIASNDADRIFNQINGFADYGFPESHAASFALLVYASAYLKHYYAPEFTAAILNAQPMGFYAPGTLVEDARRHGVEVRPVDVTRSGWDATLERDEACRSLDSLRSLGMTGTGVIPSGARSAESRDLHLSHTSNAPAVRLGLRSVRGLGATARDRLEQALADGPFTSVEDVVRRSGLDQRGLRHLAEAGAFDALVPHEPDVRRRRAALWSLLDAARGDAGPLAPRARTPSAASAAPLPSMTRVELTEADYRMTGISLAGHPMVHVRPVLEPNGVRSAIDLLRHGRDGERVATAGLVICRQRPGTAKGFVFLTLEDETGLINVVVTPQRFERQALLISRTPLLLVRGVLQVEQKVVNVRAQQFRALQAAVGAEFAKRHDFH